MRRTRRVWWKAAGLLLAATAASPVLAQEVSGTMALPEDTPPKALPSTRTDTLPAPRTAVPAAPVVQPAPAAVVAPPTAACALASAAKRPGGFWQRWHGNKPDCQAHMWGYPAEFEAPPLGASVHAHFRTMVANGEAAAMVLYRCDFLEGTNTLNQHGRDQLTRIACLLGTNAAPIIIERTLSAPGLAEARRDAVLNILALNNIPVPPDRVVLGPPIAAGLSGVDAMALYGYSLNNLAVQAIPFRPPSRGAASTGSGGGGAGAGGLGGGGLGGP